MRNVFWNPLARMARFPGRRAGRLLLLTAVLTAVLYVCGCGGGSSGPGGSVGPSTSGSVNSVSGQVVKGAVANATVTVFNVNADGSNGSVVGAGTTDGSGKFKITLLSTPTGSVRVVVTGGTYTSEADGSTVASTSPVSALITKSSEASNVAVDALTDFVDSLTKFGLSTGKSMSDAHSNAENVVAGLYGISGNTDVESLLPDFSKSAVGKDSGKVALVLGALTELGKTLDGGDPDAVIAALSLDLVADGLFNGKGPGGAPITLGGGALPSTAGTTDTVTALGKYSSSGTALADAGILSSDLSSEVSSIDSGISTSKVTPTGVGLSPGSSGAISTLSFGGHQFLFVAARSQGVVVMDITDPTLPANKRSIKVWSQFHTLLGQDVGGVLPIAGGPKGHEQLAVFAYNSKQFVLANAQLLTSTNPSTVADLSTSSIIDFNSTLPIGGGVVTFSGGSADIAGGIPVDGVGIWLACSSGTGPTDPAAYRLFSLADNSLSAGFPIPTGGFLAENLGADLGGVFSGTPPSGNTFARLVCGSYESLQLINLARNKSFNMNAATFAGFFPGAPSETYDNGIDGDSADSNLHVAVLTFEDTSKVAFVNLLDVVENDTDNTFNFSGTHDVAFISNVGPATLSGSATESSTHTTLCMAGFSNDITVGTIQNPESLSDTTQWQGFSDWCVGTLTSFSATVGYSYARDPHAVGVVLNLQTGKPFGYLLDANNGIVEIDMQGYLALPRGATTPNQLKAGTDPSTSGVVKELTFSAGPTP